MFLTQSVEYRYLYHIGCSLDHIFRFESKRFQVAVQVGITIYFYLYDVVICDYSAI